MNEARTKTSSIRDNYRPVLGMASVLVFLYLTSLYSYPLFHSFAELFSIVIACTIFIIAWNSRKLLDNNYLLFVGIAYLFVGGIDLVHTLAFKGMGVFVGYTANLPTQLWIAARYTESIALLIAPLMLGRKLKGGFVFAGYAVWTGVLLASILGGIFPVAFVEGAGLTPFKVISEYIIAAILIVALVLLYKKKGFFDEDVRRLLAASIIVTIAQEMAFTLYVDPFGLLNQVGHYLKIIAFYLIYIALIETGLERPYNLLFRELKQSEEQLRLLVEGVKDHAIFMLDPQGRIMSWSGVAERVSGYAADEIIGEHVSRFYSEEDKKAGKPEHELKMAAEHGSYQEEGWRLRKDGSLLWAYANTSALRNADHSLRGFVRATGDMTERKQAEMALDAERERLAVTLASIGDGVIATDTEGNVVLLNEIAEELTGWTRDEAKGRSMTEVFHIINEQTRELAENPVEKALKEGITVGLVNHTVLIAKDGTERSVDDSCAPIRDRHDNIIGAVLVFRDVTEAKRAEYERMQLTNRIQLLLESTDEGIYGIDMDGTCIFVNKAAADMVGYEPEEALGNNMHELIHHTRSDGTPYPIDDCPVVKAFRTGQGVRVSTDVFWRKDGTSFPVEYSSNPIIEGGDIKGAVVAFTDISERKMAEELNEALNRINAAISSTLNFDEIMERVIVESAKAISAETASIGLRNNDHWIIRYVHGLPREWVGARYSDEQAPHAAYVAKTREMFVVNDIYNDDRVNPITLEGFKIRSFLLLPLIVKDDFIGVLIFNHHSAAVPFTEAQIDFANKLAVSLSLALENARLYEAEHRIADTLQSAVLTVPDWLPGVDYGYLYRSAAEAAKIGGDFYDFFELGANNVGFVVGDVSGKGLSAAALTSMVKSTIRAFACHNPNPSYVLAEANNAIERQIEVGQFVTAIYGVINISNGSTVIASAGHPDPFICGATGCTQRAAKRNQPLGILPGAGFDSFEVTLNPGDTMVLYTDGLIEAKRDGELFGDDRVNQVLDNVYTSPTQDILSALLLAAEEFTDYKLSDDIAIVALRYTGAADPIDDEMLTLLDDDVFA